MVRTTEDRKAHRRAVDIARSQRDDNLRVFVG